MTSFLIAFAFSFVGSIPPGAINISVIQLSLESKIRSAVYFSLAASIVELPYAFIALTFSEWIMSNQIVLQYIKLIGALVMIVLGTINLISYFKLKNEQVKIRDRLSGFKNGFIISIVNPLAIPFWIVVTTYLINMEWIVLQKVSDKLLYTLGVSAGTLALLLSLIALSNKFNIRLNNQRYAKLIPAIIFYLLGFYALFEAYHIY